MSEPDVETGGSAIAIRETSGAAIVKAVPIPAQLQELGVRIAEDEGGLRVIVLPPAVRRGVEPPNAGLVVEPGRPELDAVDLSRPVG